MTRYKKVVHNNDEQIIDRLSFYYYKNKLTIPFCGVFLHWADFCPFFQANPPSHGQFYILLNHFHAI